MKNIRASIDIGSNSILLLIGSFENGIFNKIISESRVTALGFKLDENKMFHNDSMKKSFEVLKEYSQIAKENGISPSEIITTATEASRVAKNSKDFFSKVKNETQIEVKIITSDAEAYYSAKGILFDQRFQENEAFILDIGGASSEVIKVETSTKKVLDSFSFPMGAVRATNWIESGILDIKLKEIFKNFSFEIEKFQTERLYCVAGTMTSVANMFLNTQSFEEEKIHGFGLKFSDLENILDRIKTMKSDEILKDYPFLRERSKTIRGGLEVALNILKSLHTSKIEISTYGLRYGTILEGRVLDEHIA